MFRFSLFIVSAATWVLVASTSLAVSYYIDADGGSDSNSGTSPAQAWASLSHAGSQSYMPGDRILLQRGDTYTGKLELIEVSGAGSNPVQIATYGAGSKPVIDAAGYLACVRLQGCSYIDVMDLELTADGGATVDGSDSKKRYGLLADTGSGQQTDSITASNLTIHTIYPETDSASEGHNPTTYLGTGIRVAGRSDSIAANIRIEECDIRNVGYKAMDINWLDEVQIINNYMEDIGGPAIVPLRTTDLLVRGNTVDGSGQYSDPRMHGRGSGIWPWTSERVLIEKNRFMHARGRYDSCGIHIDFNCRDVVVQYNLSVDNEGGFVEILGNNYNNSYRYNISINDGARRAGTNENGLGVGDGHVLLFSGHNGTTNRAGPYDSYIYNNTIYVAADQPCSFSIEESADGIMVANNLFYIDGHAEDGTSPWLADYPAGIENGVIWTNNLYQRGGIFPDWIFTEGDPIYGNPNLPNPGGFTAEDYIPLPGAFVEGRGIAIPMIPGDAIGMAIGLAVSNDYFGNPIQGLPDVGAVEVGGGVSTILGSAFQGFPISGSNGAAAMAAVSGPAGAEYFFEETTGNYGGDDSGWQSDTYYTDSGLLPNTPYTYTITFRDASDVVGASSVVELVTPPSTPPFPDYVILNEDFSTRPNPANAVAPFPLNTWYLDTNATWSAESQDASVTDQPDEKIQLGFGYDEVQLQYNSSQTWDPARDYEFSGDWKVETIFSNNYGVIVGVAELDPSTGALLLPIIKEITVGELVSPIAGQTGSFTLSISSNELQAAGVSTNSLIGVYLHRDDDGTLNSQSGAKSDMYSIDNLYMRFFGDDIDTDFDGIPDVAETAVGLDPDNAADGTGDLDLDGMLNDQEYLIGTDMDGTNAVFTISAGVSTNVPEVIVSEPWIISNRVYILEQKPVLTTSDVWKPVDAASGTLEAGKGDYAFTQMNSETQSFYRVRVEWE
ncbi:right-handed parallel beta-helix repeat-containing protein [Pontiella sulfatireligans]|uniref:Right handed beta helix domain-containing protein n=1 Tax=Pontiella sulfatireligans TaxID=2750658 RepID=A0A6C2UUA8_9BACT|nr:right-handed parallel beta-helix repeat-containing protein [Pontiella sulfatireligans]VGO22476.1 hypothetical protein SCARR_04559 [Pontiella sulfatireligans]